MGYQIKDVGSHFLVQLNHYNFTTYDNNQKTFIVYKFYENALTVAPPLPGELDIKNLMSGSCKFNLAIIDCNNDPSDISCTTGSWSRRFISLQNGLDQLEISGFSDCKQPVDELKIRNLIISNLKP